MKAYLLDLRRLFTGRIALAVLVLALLGGALASSAAQPPSPQVLLNGSGYYFYTGGTAHVTLWLYDVAGDPVSDVGVTFGVLNGTNPLGLGNYTYVSAESNDAGLVTVTLKDHNVSYVEVSLSEPGVPAPDLEAGGVLGGFMVGPGPIGQIVGLDPLSAVATNDYNTLGRLLVTWAGPNGTTPEGTRVIVCDRPWSPFGQGPGNCTGRPTTTLATLTGPRTLVAAPVGPQGNTSLVELVGPDGTVIDSFGYGGGEAVPGSPVQPQPTLTVYVPDSERLANFASVETLLIILMALMLAFAAYAQPRLSSTMEPILVRPVTRRGLLLERYAGILLMLGATIVADVTIFCVAAGGPLGGPVPFGYAAALAASLFAAAAAVAGLVLLLAHLFKTSAAVVTGGVALVAAFGLFWSQISSFITSATGQETSSYTALVALNRCSVASPVGLPSAVLDFVTGGAAVDGVGNPYAIANITPGLLVTVAVLWIVLPMLGALWMATVRD